MPWPQTVATHCHAQLGIPDKCRVIKGLVVCYSVWLESMKGMGHTQGAQVLVLCCGQDGKRAQVLQQPSKKHHNVT